MKHLRKFNESIDPIQAAIDKGDGIRETLSDICLDLTDIGYEIEFPFRGHTTSTLDITRVNNSTFWYSEVKEVVDRIEQYLGSKFIGVYVLEESTGYKGSDQWEVLCKNCETKVVRVKFNISR